MTVAKRITQEQLDDLMELTELMTRKEELHDDLKPWVVESGPFGPMLKHPLVQEAIFDPTRCARINLAYDYKQKAVTEAKQKRDWFRYLFLHERPYRIDAFADIADLVSDEDYWTMLRHVYVDSENVWQNRDDWRDFLSSTRPQRHLFSSEDVQAVFSLPPEKGGLLPETVIYRGFRHDDYDLDDGLDGFSWTLDRARAKWFARRFPHRGGVAMVAAAKVKAEHVLAYLTDRDEQEIVVLPECVHDVTVEEVEE